MRYRRTLLPFLILFLLTGCETSEEDDLSDAPQIPPGSTFLMDFTTFPDDNGQTDLPQSPLDKGGQIYSQTTGEWAVIRPAGSDFLASHR